MSEKPGRLVWGVEALDELLGRSLIPGTSILVAGNPGAGKTTLSATICYANALRGHPCLYVSFYEDEDRFVAQMKRYGMDFAELRERGLFQYAKIPLVLGGESIETILETINQYVDELKARVVVIDSFTPMGLMLSSEIKAREVLHNYFYSLAKLTQGLVVIIAEIPYGYQRVEIGGIEFVTDVVIILKHIVSNRLLSRLLEIRKARGAPISIAELPFSIVDGKGIRVYAPPVIKTIPPPRRDIVYEPPCQAFHDVLGPLYPGETAYVVYPPDCRIRELLLPILTGFILRNKLKTLIISYHRSPSEIKEGFKSMMAFHGRLEAFEELSKLLAVYSINPSSMSLEEIYSMEIRYVETVKPQLVVFENTERISYIHGEAGLRSLYYKYLSDELLLLRKRGVLSVRVSSYTNEDEYNRGASLADIVARVIRRISDEEVTTSLYVWRSGRVPRMIHQAEIEACIAETCSSCRKWESEECPVRDGAGRGSSGG